jgi:hypothetical protein
VALSPLRRIERWPRGVVDGQAEQHEDRCGTALERRIDAGKAAQRARPPFGGGAGIEIQQRLEQPDDGQVGRRRSV